MLIASLSVPILRTLQVRLMALEQWSDGPFPPTIDLARTNERDAAMSFPPPPPRSDALQNGPSLAYHMLPS